ncbi:MAG: hypothetical protein R3A44_03010 [Caldilineaceae bacterium]
MLIYRSTQRRLWTTLFVLLYLVAQTLPASTSTATAQASNCGGVAAQAADASALVVHAADEQVTIPKEKVDAAVFEAGLYDSTFDRVRLFVEMQVMLQKAAGQTDYAGPMNEYRDRINALFPGSDLNEHTYDEVVHTLLDTALQIPELAPVVPGIWSRLNDENAYSRFTVDSRTNIIQSAQRYDLGERILALAPEIAIQVHGCAQKNDYFAELFDTFNLDKLGFSIRDNAKTILANDTDLIVPEGIRNNIADDGTVTISLDQLKALGKSELDQLHTTIDGMQDTLVEIDSQQKEIIDYLKDQALKAKYQELARKKAAEYQLKLDAARAGISIITTISAQIDPKFAKDFNVVAGSTLQVGVAINSWIKATAGLGSLNKVFSLSTVVMTGNVLGAVMNVISLFGDSGPTPEEQILEEIGQLRQQVNELRIEMHERFDRIDQSLNNIYTTMHDRFDQIDIQLGRINGNIVEVQQSLVELDLKLSRIERNNFEFLNALGRRPLLEAINGGLGYAERTGQPMPFQPEFVDFENTLHSWGTIHAYDPLNAGPTQRDYSDAQMLSELNAYPMDANINYINGWLLAHGLPGIANSRLPSPRDWLFASRAYTQLALEWPAHMKRIDPKRKERLEEIGVELEAAMRNLSTLTTITGTVGNELLISSVSTNYEDKVDGLNSAIQVFETNFMNEVRSQRLGRAEPFNIHGSIFQPITYRSPETKIAGCGFPAENAVYTLPSGFEQRIPSFDIYNLAEYLKVGFLSTCVHDLWLNPVQICQGGQCHTEAEHRVVLSVEFAGRSLMLKTLSDGRMAMPTSGIMSREFWTKLPFNYKERFTNFPEPDPSTPALDALRQELFNNTLHAVELALQGYQHELYGRILDEMNKGVLKGPVGEANGSKALLDTVVSLGLPRAVAGDEFLHAMLYGNQQLADNQMLVQDYMVKLSEPITMTSLTANPRQQWSEVADQRNEVFRELVDGYLAAITQHDHAEAPDYIANTRRALDLTMRIIAVEAAPTPTPTSTPGAGQPTATPTASGQPPTPTPVTGGDQPTPTPMPGGGQPTATPVTDNGLPTPVSGTGKPVYLPLIRR